MLLSSFALQKLNNNDNNLVQVGSDIIQENIERQMLNTNDDVTIVLYGKYKIILTPLIIDKM